MNPVLYLKFFAWIAIVGLCCLIFADHWLPILVGTAALTLLVMMLHPTRY